MNFRYGLLRLRPRFSLRTLLCAVLLAGSAVALCANWEPWCVAQTIRLTPENFDPKKTWSWTNVGFTPDGTQIFTLHLDCDFQNGPTVTLDPQKGIPKIALYDSGTNKQLWSASEKTGDRFASRNNKPAFCTEFSAGKKWLFYVDAPISFTLGYKSANQLHFWSLQSHKPLVLPPVVLQAAQNAVNEALKKIPALTSPGGLTPVDEDLWSSPLNGVSARSLAYTENDALAALLWKGNLYFFDPETGRLIHTLDTGQPKSSLLGFSSDGSRIAMGSPDGTLVWDWATDKQVSQLKKQRPDFAQWLHGARFNSQQIQQAIRDMEFWPDPRPSFNSKVIINPDGSCSFTSADRDESALRKHALELLGKNDPDIQSAEASPDGTHVVTADANGIVKIWGLRRDQTLGSANMPECWITIFFALALLGSLWRDRRY